MHIYSWTLGFDLTPADVARKFGHPEIADLIVSTLSTEARILDALWCGDRERVHRELALDPISAKELEPHSRGLLAAAAWWYRPESVRLMLELGFDPHVPGMHRSTPLDRALDHPRATIVFRTPTWAHPRGRCRSLQPAAKRARGVARIAR